MALKIGDKAPDFEVNDQDGVPVKLSDLQGQKVVLYFYPKDMTPGCTAESCNLRDNYERLQQQGYEVLGISSDDEQSHRKFIEQQNLPFRLLADTDRKVHDAYGTWVEKQMYGRNYMGTARVTFVIDEQGVIEDVIDKVDTENHTRQILKTASNGEATYRADAIPSTPASATAPAKKTVTKKVAKKAPAKAPVAAKKAAPKKVVKKVAKKAAKKVSKKAAAKKATKKIVKKVARSAPKKSVKAAKAVKKSARKVTKAPKKTKKKSR
ncbi:thioredoxin-dependent thiol peroxidase [Fulvivirgaceae bacterium PWU5]|uniref:thioredoxin-dependent peroxiredoxin n=1 Tax=Dawidia cretensis TaxID=2782350 RepID=A0AAP2GTP5_9BACT|nr:thioredoxin-dependent thiol peroxidase [Dawidia cretensis]MBT1708493.1 thioredoxin-dependent thiol peroxidase [Dawidia cretensis]